LHPKKSEKLREGDEIIFKTFGRQRKKGYLKKRNEKNL
jgi:hypothetical protein